MYCFYKSSEVACFFRFVAEIRIDGWLILSHEGLRTVSFPRTKTVVILFSSALDLNSALLNKYQILADFIVG